MSQQHNSHDALNDYLDALVGTQTTAPPSAGLDPGMRGDVDALFDLARRSGMLNTGSSSMNATITTAPLPSHGGALLNADVHNRLPLPGRTLNTWLSSAIVLLMLVGIVGGAWWFGPGQRDDEPLRLAALTDESTPVAIWPEPLSPGEAPWIAAISPEECTAEPLPYSDYAEAKTTDPGPPDGSYEIVGVPDPEDAQAVVTTLRGWLACGDLGHTTRIRAYYTAEFLFYSDISIDNAPYQEDVDQWRADAQREWAAWTRDTGFDPITVITGVEPPPQALETFAFAQAFIDGEASYTASDQQMLTYYEARYDPADTVLLADGRIMIPTRYVFWAEDPWGLKYGYASEMNLLSAAIVLEQVDGQWKIDEASSIWL